LATLHKKNHSEHSLWTTSTGILTNLYILYNFKLISKSAFKRDSYFRFNSTQSNYRWRWNNSNVSICLAVII